MYMVRLYEARTDRDELLEIGRIHTRDTPLHGKAPMGKVQNASMCGDVRREVIKLPGSRLTPSTSRPR
ncbi:hypothetical protein EVAR_85376_1 [Eumeta japonica]|uniref:Uncharacterized protein n=1 Tax=Eumeta variegata TaxID=151549 RepID=A0A4C1WSX2_EUMVA|nr:hypothetical protein EVAR_85376_1 [Eumeta japonica]